ncbi:hypothetical protein B0A50_01715 [Salinomyces thailandicus]|uniref:Laccase n=1 Tax=Salinomyces thailandicus TaxID=706561 RepID=A0A4U0U8X7_9PEZI|nr:hypothetical protein B0A50_01715 [Salinomyces thailandica]
MLSFDAVLMSDAQSEPWGGQTCYESNPYDAAPETGVTRHYNFTLSRQVINIDGYDNLAILVNDLFPGPLIEANWGDWIDVDVTKHLDEGSTLHWHGFKQTGTPWYDGSPGIGQCPIVPGKTLKYRFRAEQYGHYSAQYADDAVGPIVIYGPKSADYDHDLGPVMLSDYYDRPYFGPVADATGTSEDFDVYVPASDNNFINGRPSYAYNGSLTGTHSSACDPSEIDTGLETFRFKSGKSDRLRLINSGAAAFQYFSIDEHVLEVIAVDFTPIKPYNTTVLPLGIGQRANVLIHGSQAPDAAYWMRATVGTNCSRGSVNETKAMVYYDQAPQDARPTSQPYYIPNTWCTDVPLDKTIPLYPKLRELEVPGSIQQTCRDWQAYSEGNVVEQSDAGL